ncbi:beta-lactamase like protein [Psychroflexus torquis ATCC 700755]|uniref:Beta-lactamase like protein n=1 Tax=Psychroflexus torquis (strain ATCC 700755 / CIP 106069 / ACAM 623) TaxID=313595 RepID=K4IXF2_PSYTT|nr:serine hydrolase [Psychroflexus torquis]AFU70140.1 beta-lactamase like protein [Psychroflexus torquis ATCC 700755]
MNTQIRILISITFITSLTCSAFAQDEQNFEYTTPQSLGFSAVKLDSLSKFLASAGSSSLILLVDGKIIFEWGKTNYKHTIHSIRKPLISALYGIYVEKGIIDTTATLQDLNIDDIIPSLSENEKSARIIDLLKARSGVYHDAAANSSGMVSNRPERDEFIPNENYFYNNWDFNVLGAILEQAAGKSVFELFKTEIADPIGMDDYLGEYSQIDGEDENASIPNVDGFYQYEKSKSNYPAYHFRLSARDMAKFGQLYLNNGNWKGKQIIQKSWIEVSTKAYSVTNPGYGIGYGMLWSVLMKNEFRKSSSFYHTGTNVHMLGIYPSSKVVLVHRVDTEKKYTFNQNDFYKMIELVWDSKIE